MRVFEILILVTLFVRFVGYSFSAIKRSRWIDFIPSLTMLFTIMPLAFEKYRLQMVPAYGLTLLLFLLSIHQLQRGRQSRAKKPPNRVVSSLGFLLRLSIFTVIATLPIIIPVFQQFAHPHARTLPTTGLYGDASLRVRKIGLANDFLQGKSPPPAVNAEHLRIWTEDIRFLIDELERIKAGDRASLLVGKLDMNRLGIFGQSFGGVTAVKVCMVDDRCQAGLSLDSGLPSDYASSAPDSPLKQPFMFMLNEVAGHDRSGILGLLKNTAYGIAVQGTTYLDYTDLYLYSPVLRAYPKIVP